MDSITTESGKTYFFKEPELEEQRQWPHIFLYYYPSLDQYASVPLHNGKAWKLKIFDLVRYEALSKSGAIYAPSHTGIENVLVDNTTGAIVK